MKVVQVKVPEFLFERDVKVAAAIEAFSKGLVSVGSAEIAEMPVRVPSCARKTQLKYVINSKRG